MSKLLEQALEKAAALPEEEQNAIASQILFLIDDEARWNAKFAAKREILRRMAREALDEDAAGQTVPLEQIL